MSSTPSDLKGLRRRLDEIDKSLQELLIDRAEIVSLVAASKRNDNLPAFQPSREAEIIRRLVERHHGAFPVATLIRMWREMLAATVRLQSPFSVAVFAPPDRQGFWDLARDHYGSNTPISAYGSADTVLRAVTEGRASVGVLPTPEDGEPDPWWRHLLTADKNAPCIITRLPFGPPGNARNCGAGALAIGRGVQLETGLDRTLMAAGCTAEISRDRTLEALSSLGLACTFFASYRHSGGADTLFEVDDFVAITDPRLDCLRATLDAALYHLGGYAVPLPAAALSSKG